MTSRRSLPRRSSGSRAARALAALAGLIVLGAAVAAAAAPLTEARDGAEIDWAAGTVTATAGAAADLRMPGADVARAGALRRAQAAARAQLARVLAELPLGGGRKPGTAAVERAVARARPARVEYQSNGGAVVWLAARFDDLQEKPATPPAGEGAPVAVLAVPSMHLAAAPLAKIGDAAEVALGAAVYHVGAAPADARALTAKVDRAGRLVIDGARDGGLARKLARGTVLIYVGKVLK
jgi:hypothetical protein